MEGLAGASAFARSLAGPEAAGQVTVEPAREVDVGSQTWPIRRTTDDLRPNECFAVQKR